MSLTVPSLSLETLKNSLNPADFVAGFGTALFVSPFVTTIDKSVVEAANGREREESLISNLDIHSVCIHLDNTSRVYL